MFLSNNPSSGDINSSNLPCSINYVCYWFLFFCCQYVEASLKKCKTFDFSVFAAISLAVAFKIRKVDYVWSRVTRSSIFCSMEDLYRVNKLIRLPHFMIH